MVKLRRSVVDNENEKVYSTKEFAKIVGVGVKTLYNWDRDGKLIAKRKFNGYKYYTQEDIDLVLGK